MRRVQLDEIETGAFGAMSRTDEVSDQRVDLVLGEGMRRVPAVGERQG